MVDCREKAMNDYPDVPIPEKYDVKEVYAFFGLAAYMAQVLERGVIIFSVALRIGSVPNVTRDLVDELYENFEEKTLGQLLKIAKSASLINNELYEELYNSLKLRNRLIHSYFYEHAEDFMSEQGRKIMINELRHMTNIFEETDKKLEGLSSLMWEKYGVTKDIIDNEFKQIVIRAKNKYGAI